MADNEIIKALECCGDPYDICANCPIPNDIKDDCRCGEHLANNALDLITRQQAEIEKLKEQIAEVNKTIKSEAIKEFVDRLKEVSSEMVMMCDNGTPISISYSISSKKLDSILKEMVGDKK